MAVTPTEPDLQGQQVMTAQVTEATLQSRGVGHSTLEGESQGPDYGRQQSQPPQLPNGVARASPTSSVRTVDGIESLPYSPQVDPATRPAQAFFQEAWPAQPQNADVGSSDSRSAEGVPAAFRWMHRLGDFLRSQSAMETFTTMTRQQLVTPAAGGGSFVLQQQRVQRTTSPSASRSGGHVEEVTGERAGTEQFPGNGNPPLFGRSAARRMEDWANQAPLLHGPPARPTIRDDVSSNSIPREVVEEEVRRQVQLALQGQQQGMKELREENQRLRERLEVTPSRPAPTSSRDPAPGDNRAYTADLGVSGGDRAFTHGQAVPEDNRAYAADLGVSGGDRAFTHSQAVPGDNRAYAADLGVSGGDRAFTHSQAVPGDNRAYAADLGVSGGDRAFTHSQAVPGDNRAYAADRGVSGGDRAFTRSQAVPEDSRAYTADRGVSGGDRAFVHSQIVPEDSRAYTADRGVSGGDRAFTRSQSVPEDSRAYAADRGVSVGDRAWMQLQGRRERGDVQVSDGRRDESLLESTGVQQLGGPLFEA